VYWSCAALLMRRNVPILLECARCEVRRMVDTSLLQRDVEERLHCCKHWHLGVPILAPRNTAFDSKARYGDKSACYRLKVPSKCPIVSVRFKRVLSFNLSILFPTILEPFPLPIAEFTLGSSIF
jgi:hypothetical protein